MQYFTLVPKHTRCPYWDIDICIDGKYVLGDNNIGRFTHGVCPILENIRKHPDKDNDDLWMYPFCRISKPCTILSSGFPETIDFNEHPCPALKEK